MFRFPPTDHRSRSVAARRRPSARTLELVIAQQRFTISLRRLDAVGGSPGLIQLSVQPSEQAGSAETMGALTDVALRARLAHFDLHPANEIAFLRKALAQSQGQATLRESWPELASCVRFWNGFIGSQIRRMAWTCEKCGRTAGENIGGSVGEVFLSRCPCGQVLRVTVPR
jgi:hypothetical protein